MKSGAPFRGAVLRGTPVVFLSCSMIFQLMFPSAFSQASAPANYKPDSVFVALLANGDALVEYDVRILDQTRESTVTLFANQDVRNLIAADYSDHIVPFDPGQARNQIILNSANATAIRITYSTQDLLNKTGRVWAFSLSSPVGFTVKLPQDSVLTDYSGTSSPSINTVGGQYLLTFDAGTGNISYVIGVVGTEEHASVLIRAADTTIRQTQDQYPGIVLANAQSLLKNATTQLNAKMYANAEQLASQANDAALATGREYSDAQTAISAADSAISAAASQGRDVSSATSLLQTAKAEFSSGRYSDAKNSAADAAAAIGKAAPQDFPTSVIIISAVVGAGGVGAMLFIRMRHKQPAPQVPSISESEQPSSTAQKSVPEVRSEPEALPAPEKPEPSSFVPAHAVAGPHEDSSLLARIVGRILIERPHLRPEDQQVLQFLAEKEGAAFESEIRGKFLLPKTTIWRLVKRLEREELVEIRKAGGQNLIKLRFEGRQP